MHANEIKYFSFFFWQSVLFQSGEILHNKLETVQCVCTVYLYTRSSIRSASSSSFPIAFNYVCMAACYVMSNE